MNANALLKGLVMLLMFALGQEMVAGSDQGKVPPVTDKAASASMEKGKNIISIKKPVTIPVYLPPMRGAPVARVGGGTRSIGDNLPYISVVTPEHTGFTSSPQPVLYWYLSEPVDTRFEFALINNNEIDPIIEVVSDKGVSKGLSSLDLSEHGVSLKPGVVYQWSVAIVVRPEERSSDIFSSGTIELVELTNAQRVALAQTDDNGAVMVFAREGYWYDAFAGVSRLIAAKPGNALLVEQRTALLRQVGLDEVADAGQ